MYFVGIVKSFHVTFVIDSFKVLHLDSFSFDNNHKGFSKFIDLIFSSPKKELLIRLESTAHYSEVFAQFLFNLGFKVAIVSKSFTNVSNQKRWYWKTKTDKVDSILVAKAIVLNNFTLLEEKDMITLGLKAMLKPEKTL